MISSAPAVSEFEEEFRAFALAEALKPLPADPVLFYGSSSVRLWETLAEDFPDVRLVNRGFGGSTLAECVEEMERLVYPVRPRAIFLYAGDNDLDQGAKPESVRASLQQFVANIRQRLGALPIITMTIKPSPLRFWNIANIARANVLLRESVASLPGVQLLDVESLMLGADGTPRADLYCEDCLHLNRDGYRLWASQLRPYLESLGLCDEPRIP